MHDDSRHDEAPRRCLLDGGRSGLEPDDPAAPAILHDDVLTAAIARLDADSLDDTQIGRIDLDPGPPGRLL